MPPQRREERVIRVRRADDAENLALQIGEVFDLGFVGRDDHHRIVVQDGDSADPVRRRRIAANDGEVCISLCRSAEVVPPSAWWALASLSLSMLLSSLGTSIANVGLPTLAEAFNASFQKVQWIVLAYLLASTTLIVSVGRLGDITGRRRLLLVGIVLFTLASVLCAAAPALWLLIAARAAQGLGAAVMMVLTMAFVGETVPQAK